MSTGESDTARVAGTDATDDVAVLQLVDASGLVAVTTDPDGVTTGEAVTAVGDGGDTTVQGCTTTLPQPTPESRPETRSPRSAGAGPATATLAKGPVE